MLGTPNQRTHTVEFVKLTRSNNRRRTPVAGTFKTLRSAIRNERRGTLSRRGIVFIRDNFSATHGERDATTSSYGFWLDRSPPTRPYGSDLAIFICFLHVKSFFGGRNFGTDDDEVKGAVVNIRLQSQAASFYGDGIQKPVPRYDMHLENSVIFLLGVSNFLFLNIYLTRHVCLHSGRTAHNVRSKICSGHARMTCRYEY